MRGHRLIGLPLAGALLALAACSQQSTVADPPADRFAPGLCRSVAPAVLDIGRTARDVLRGHASTGTAVVALARSQDALRAAQQRAHPDGLRELQPLVTAIGVYRIRALSDTVSQPVAAAVASAQHRLVLRCAPGADR